VKFYSRSLRQIFKCNQLQSSYKFKKRFQTRYRPQPVDSHSIVYYSVLVGQFEFILWLAYWYQHQNEFRFDWDIANSTKSKDKHGVDTEEVESVFELKLAAPLGRQVSPTTSEERLCLVGPSSEGRLISVVFTLRNGRVRPISSRLANRKEKRLYEEVRKAIERI